MSVIKGGFGSSRRYEITNSVRLRAAASARFTRTPAGASNRTQWTWSGWVKRSTLSSAQYLFSAGTAGATFEDIRFDADRIAYYLYVGGSSDSQLITTAKYRDPSAWLHVVVARNGTTRKIYVNGVEITAFDSNTGSTTSGDFNTATEHRIGCNSSPAYFFDGYLSDVHFIDGTILTPSSFGQTDSNGVWVPKAYTGTYGTNGFHLDFKDAALTAGSNAGLGKDVSGNGKYWTTNNISVTAGVTYDSMVDTPTNNYATLNPIAPTSATGTNFAYAAAALRLTPTAATAFSGAYSTKALPDSGRFYAEAIVDTTTGATATAFGVIDGAVVLGADIIGVANVWGLRCDSNRRLCLNGTTTGPVAGTFTAGDTLQIAADVDAGKLWLGVNDQWWDTVSTVIGNPSNGTNPTASFSLAGKFIFLQGFKSQNIDVNFGQRPFTYTSYTNFKALCTANLPAVAITKPASYFNAKTRTGTAATYSVTGEAFQPDFVWAKSAGRALDHALYDSVRGVQKRLETNNTDAEFTGDSTGLTAFNSDGYTGGALDQINGTTATNRFIDWMWKASATAGLSIVTFTAPASGNSTVAHGLGKVPAMVIVKCRGATGEWSVYHQKLTTPATYRLKLNLTDAEASVANAWLNTDSTNLGYLVGTTAVASQTHVAYCFAEIAGYSKFGSYVGNAAADGTFVHCGFRPRYLMVKRTDVAGAEWDIVDAARDTYNGVSLRVYADSAAVENSTGGSPYVDFTANGFKVRTTNTDWNASTGTYIFAAFAEYPFGGSNVSPSPAR